MATKCYTKEEVMHIREGEEVGRLTGIVWLPWRAEMAAWASGWFENLTNAQPENENRIGNRNVTVWDRNLHDAVGYQRMDFTSEYTKSNSSSFSLIG